MHQALHVFRSALSVIRIYIAGLSLAGVNLRALRNSLHVSLPECNAAALATSLALHLHSA